MPNYDDYDRDVVRVHSFPLPTRTAYRLTLPFLPRALGALSIVHAHSPFVTGWLGRSAARRAGVPLVFTYHTQLDAYAHYVPFEARATRNVARQLTRAYANAADAVVVPTAAMERRLRELGVRSRIAVVPSGIDIATFARGARSQEFRSSLGVSSHQKMILAVGRLGREKNLEFALEAFAQLGDDDVRFVAIGDGPHRAALERFAAHAGVGDRVRFTGELPRERLPEAYASADAFVFASRTDTQGLVLVEALAAGLPIVAVDTPQTRDVLADAARIVRDDVSSLAAGLRDALAAPRAQGATAATRIAERYDRTTSGDRMMELYATLLS